MKKKSDWQIVLIARNFVDEVDCNSGEHRRVFNDGTIKPLINLQQCKHK